jgi:hypothetical protein
MWEGGTGKIKGKNKGKKGAENVKDSHDINNIKQRTLDPVTLQQEGNGSGRFGLKKYGGLYKRAGNLICSARKFNKNVAHLLTAYTEPANTRQL